MISNCNTQNINPENHLKLVHACCKRFRNRGAEYDDIFQSGCIGLMKAIKNFDASRGVQFSTYAVPVILGEIKTFFQNSNAIKLSRSTREIASRINVAREKYILDNNREPTIYELSNILNEPVEVIIESFDAYLPPVSIDSTFDSSDAPLINLSVDFDSEQFCDRLSVMEVIKKFEIRDRKLLYLRFFKGETQCNIAKILNMTQVQVSRREKVLLKNLRQMLA